MLSMILFVALYAGIYHAVEGPTKTPAQPPTAPRIHTLECYKDARTIVQLESFELPNGEASEWLASYRGKPISPKMLDSLAEMLERWAREQDPQTTVESRWVARCL